MMRLIDSYLLPLAAVLAIASLEPASASDRDYEPVRLGRANGRLTAIEFAPGVPDQLYVASKSG
ncbi:hypothetical protein N9L90_03820, partial [Planctomycetota bacterium]|nr:hypothetical protein [Planctomycetota bacterium]